MNLLSALSTARLCVGAATLVVLAACGGGLESLPVDSSNPGLVVTFDGGAAGSVVSTDPQGIINCAADTTSTASSNGTSTTGTCAATVPLGTTVTLVATAGANTTFNGWAGACSGTGECVVAMDTTKGVSAKFGNVSNTSTPLSLVMAGNGVVNINSAVVADPCASTCTKSFSSGTAITLTASPAAGFMFGGWTGDCSSYGSGPCTLVMVGRKTVTANFVPLYDLSVVVSGSGSVQAQSTSGTNPPCTASCTQSFLANARVTLSATPTAGRVFAGWQGACSGTGSCDVVMSSAQSVSATFTPVTFGLTVIKTGTGSGSLTSSDAKINCGTLCSATYSAGTSITLTAVPTNSTVAWAGCTASGNSCAVSIDSAKNVTATFTPIAVSLTVVKAGSGTGTVTSSAAGINCGAICGASYTVGTNITLTATPANATVAWSGCTASGNSCTVTMNAAKNVTVTFTPVNYGLTVTKAGSGSGTITSSVAGINCGATCSANFNAGSSITLTAAPSGSAVAWSGCTASGNTCAVTIDAAKTVTATFTATPVQVGTYHVRPDGGDASQCTGLANAAYPGSGTAQACAWSSPFFALPVAGQGSPRIAGGDTLLIHPGQYMIGIGAPGATGCGASYSYDCGMQSPPSGPSAARPTRIVGEGWDSTCTNPPQLWGTEGLYRVIGIGPASNVFVGCLEITDHSPCIGGQASAAACANTAPYGPQANHGIYASGVTNLTLQDLNIHGLSTGLKSGNIVGLTINRVRLAANYSAGWNGDLGSSPSTHDGTNTIDKLLVEWNGCGEGYPNQQPYGCWAQTAGGYGDGVGMAGSAGTWIIRDSTFRFNTSDGLDLLYLGSTATVFADRIWSEGNAGNQIKVSGTSTITNSVIIGTCGFFSGKSFTFNVDNCRASGDALVMSANAATQTLLAANNTIVAEGNVAILTGGVSGSVIKLRNNIMVGLPNFLSSGQQAADTYIDGGVITIDESYAVKQNLRSANCTTPNTICTTNAGLTSATRTLVTPTLVTGSPALNSGLDPASGNGIPVTDYYGKPRPAGGAVDRGAIEMQ